MKLYHRTGQAEAILSQGFRDATRTYFTGKPWTGVWFSDVPLEVADCIEGDVVLSVDLPEEAIADYEWVTGGQPYQEWLIPAELVNRYGAPVVVPDDELDRLGLLRSGGLLGEQAGLIRLWGRGQRWRLG